MSEKKKLDPFEQSMLFQRAVVGSEGSIVPSVETLGGYELLRKAQKTAEDKTSKFQYAAKSDLKWMEKAAEALSTTPHLEYIYQGVGMDSIVALSKDLAKEYTKLKFETLMRTAGGLTDIVNQDLATGRLAGSKAIKQGDS